MAKQSRSNEFVPSADFLPGAGILLVDEDAPALPSSTPLEENHGQTQMLNWGPQNDLPQQLIILANSSPELLSYIEFTCNILYGGGLYYEVSNGEDAKGKPEWKEGNDREVNQWIARNCLNDYFLESSIDFGWFNQGFAELIKNKKKTKIVQITHQESAFCRFGVQNEKGFNDKVGINANWPQASWDDELTIKVPAIDPYDLNKVQNAKASNDYKFIYPISHPSPGKIAYQGANWHSLFKSQWFDISVLIPILKKSLMKYQMTIKYIIKVPQQFWERKATDRNLVWKEMTIQEKNKLKGEVKKELNKFLTGAENAGKSFMTTFGWDQVTKTEIPGITIIPLDDKLKDGKYIEDMKESSSQFLRAFGIPVPLIGPISSGDMGGGSGSDARVHFNIYNNRQQSKKDKLLAPLNFVAQFNGWTDRLPGFRWRIREYVLDTLDVTHSTTNPSPVQ